MSTRNVLQQDRPEGDTNSGLGGADAPVRASGILAIWNDCRDEREADYEEWYQDEHLKERLGVKGFRVGRRYESVDATRQFLTTYEVDHPDVLTSNAYLERLAQPTPRTTAIMLDGFTNASRTVCERRDVEGAIRGGYVVTAVSTGPGAAESMSAMSRRDPVGITLTHREIWLPTSTEQTEPSAEAALRGKDETISGCLALEFLREEPALRTAQRLRSDFPGMDIGVYHLLCSLDKEDL